MYKSFSRASLGRKPAISLELITPDASITGHNHCDTHLILSTDELKTERARLFDDIRYAFEKLGLSEFEAISNANEDPDIALMQRALDQLS